MLAAPRSFVRFFSADKTLPSPTMNRLGAQVARTVLARMVHNMRPAQTTPEVGEHIATLKRDGMVAIPNFLPNDVFERVKQKADAVWDREQANVVVHNHGPNRLNSIPNDRVPLATEIPEFFGDPRLPAILESVERRPGMFAKHAYMAIEHLRQNGPLEMEDPETQLHSDIFFTAHKTWLYLTDVTPECGPLVYVKGSNRISPKMLSYVYRESCTKNKGSRRITKQELADLGLEETVLTMPRNTLVVANIFGYHRRERGVPGNERHSLLVGLRVNPFFARD